MESLKSALLDYSIHAQDLAGAITDQVTKVGTGQSEGSYPLSVPPGLVLAVMHWRTEQAVGQAGEPPSMPVTGNAETGFVLELGGWRAEHDDLS